MAKVTLKCTKTNGRWNQGDVASFEAETAKRYLAAKNAVWKEHKPAEDGGAEGSGGSEEAGGSGDKGATKAGAKG